APQSAPAAETVVAAAPAVEEAQAPQPEEKAVPAGEIDSDDLTAIRGIGPVMQRRLRLAGIQTYARLAESTVEELHQVLGETARLAKVEEWIEQAREVGGQA
ncbi:MAG TPA: hypothetical protein DEP84_37600, partial [Chloroflexi bacterium]|nr:hypothetical protein [Chloroflexota bacterium]